MGSGLGKRSAQVLGRPRSSLAVVTQIVTQWDDVAVFSDGLSPGERAVVAALRGLARRSNRRMVKSAAPDGAARHHVDRELVRPRGAWTVGSGMPDSLGGYASGGAGSEQDEM